MFPSSWFMKEISEMNRPSSHDILQPNKKKTHRTLWKVLTASFNFRSNRPNLSRQPFGSLLLIAQPFSGYQFGAIFRVPDTASPRRSLIIVLAKYMRSTLCVVVVRLLLSASGVGSGRTDSPVDYHDGDDDYQPHNTTTRATHPHTQSKRLLRVIPISWAVVVWWCSSSAKRRSNSININDNDECFLQLLLLFWWFRMVWGVVRRLEMG